MASRGRSARSAGIRFERAVAQFLGTRTTRSTRPGVHDDAGDVHLPGHVVECKDHGRWTVEAWWRELLAKAQPGETPVLVLKRRGQPIGEALVVQRLSDWWADNDKEGA